MTLRCATMHNNARNCNMWCVRVYVDMVIVITRSCGIRFRISYVMHRLVIQTSTPTTVITSMEIVQRLPHQINRIFCHQKLQCRLSLCRRRRRGHRRQRRRYQHRRHHRHRQSIQPGKAQVVQRSTQSNLHVSRASIVWSTHRRQRRPPYCRASYRARTTCSCHQHNKNTSTSYDRRRFHERSWKVASYIKIHIFIYISLLKARTQTLTECDSVTQ